MRKVLMVAAVAGLVGCGGAPSDKDVQAAMYDTMRKVAGEAGAKSQQDTIDSIKLLGCKKAETNGYHCDWESKMGAGSGRLVKGESGWVLVGQ